MWGMNLLEIGVSDTGEGIPEDNLRKIFEPLFSTKAKGIGLGLALSKSRVEAHGGTLGVESETGKGTTFKIRIPVQRRLLPGRRGTGGREAERGKRLTRSSHNSAMDGGHHVSETAANGIRTEP